MTAFVLVSKASEAQRKRKQAQRRYHNVQAQAANRQPVAPPAPQAAAPTWGPRVPGVHDNPPGGRTGRPPKVKEPVLKPTGKKVKGIKPKGINPYLAAGGLLGIAGTGALLARHQAKSEVDKARYQRRRVEKSLSSMQGEMASMMMRAT